MAVKVRREDVLREAARPMEYFTHDAHAFGDIKVQRMFDALGYEGYGRWWHLCELMASTEGHEMRVDGVDGRLWARRLGTDEEGLQAFADVLVASGLASVDGGVLRLPGMQRRAEKLGAQIACGRANGMKGGRPKGSS